MENPWFILIVLAPVYLILSLAVLGVGCVLKKRRRFVRGFVYSLLGFFAASLAYVAALLLISLTPFGDRPISASSFSISLAVFYVFGLWSSYYFAMKKEPTQPPEPTRPFGPSGSS